MKRIIVAAVGIAALLFSEMSLAAPPAKGKPMPKGNNSDVDYEFNVLEDAKVRLLNPPVEFDEKGQPKKFSSEESKKRKGDTPAEQKLPGIKCEFNVLKPGDVVQVSFSRPKNPKDLENTTWSSVAGQMTGVITNVDADKEEGKIMTVRVSPNGPPQGGDKGGGRMKQRGEAGSRNTIKPEQRQASVIVIVEQAPEPENRGKGFKKKKKT
jgi:hypothetical protein